MFTGIVEQTGRIDEAQQHEGHLRVRIAPDHMWQDLHPGESIAVNGVCLTVAAWDERSFEVDLSRETLAKTSNAWVQGRVVNLERAVPVAGRLGGHIVSGHIDAVGEVREVREEPGAFVVQIRGPYGLAKHLVPKGSITVDGVSLTVVDVGGPGGNRIDLEPEEFTLWLVPHTLQVTSLRFWQAGTKVNLEGDQVSKYLHRLIQMRELERPVAS